jgi:hypothetical protein
VNLLFLNFSIGGISMITCLVKKHFIFLFSHREKQIESVRQVNKDSNLCKEKLNQVPCIFPPSILNNNSHNFYDPINSLMEDVFINHSSPWHDFLLQHSSPFAILEQTRRIVL